MTKREHIQKLLADDLGPTEIAKIVGCNISLVYYHGQERYRRKCIDRLLALKKVNKIQALEYKGGKCLRCGYNKCPAALVFHHKDPMKKEFRIGGVPHTWVRLKKELDKTVLLCCLCHTELHAGYWTTEELQQHGLEYHPLGENTGKLILPPSKRSRKRQSVRH